MRVFKTKPFGRFASHNGIPDEALCDAARRAQRGSIDADLGGGVIKQRIARRGQGKSGGFRSIVLFRRGETAFFVYGFAKSDRDNLRRDELKAFRKLADQVLALDDEALARSDEERNHYGDQVPWLSSTRATHWRPCTRRRAASPTRASWTSGR